MIAYLARTRRHTYWLDHDGICRDVTTHGGERTLVLDLRRCVGAQYVASLGADGEPLLVAMPRPGASLLMARAEPDGRITLLRTGTLVAFEEVTLIASDVAAQGGRPRGGALASRSREASPRASDSLR